MINKYIIDIEKELNVTYQREVEPFGLPLWYDAVREKRINELTDGDIARFIRQNMYLNYIVPEALKRVKISPTIGDLYCGEILQSFAEVNFEFWQSNINILKEVYLLIDKLDRKEFKIHCDWLYPEEEEEFLNKVKDLKRLLYNSVRMIVK